MTDADAAQLSRLKSFNFSFVMFKEIKLFCDVWTGVKTRKDLHPPAGSGSVPPLSRGLEPGKTLPSCPGYAQATPVFSVVSVTKTAYLSSDRTGAETGNPEVTGTKPTHYLLLIGSGLPA